MKVRNNPKIGFGSAVIIKAKGYNSNIATRLYAFAQKPKIADKFYFDVFITDAEGVLKVLICDKEEAEAMNGVAKLNMRQGKNNEPCNPKIFDRLRAEIAKRAKEIEISSIEDLAVKVPMFRRYKKSFINAKSLIKL